METGLLHDYFGNFSTRDEKYYFRVEGNMQGEIEPRSGEIETSIESNIPAWLPDRGPHGGGGVPDMIW